MKSLYRRLSKIGLPKTYVRRMLLPDWWDDEAANQPGGFAEAALLIARRLGVDVDVVRDEGQEICLPEPSSVKFKTSKQSNPNEMALARALALQVARFAALGVEVEAQSFPQSASEIREEILGRDEPWVSLKNLLDFCWSIGVPVVHVSVFPKTAKKMQALAARVDDRPVVVISSVKARSAWLLFPLAHELGHIVLGHVKDEEVLIDAEIDEESRDEEEMKANAFAVELLTGNSDTRFTAPGRWPKATGLAEAARVHGDRGKIDPGHIVLNYASSMKASNFFGVANAALKILEPEPEGLALIRESMAANLDWSRLPEEASEFVARITQSEPAPAS